VKCTQRGQRPGGGWVLDLLPPTAEVGLVTGATMANFTCLSAARQAVLHRVGWDVARDGLAVARARAAASRGGATRVRRPGAALSGLRHADSGAGGRAWAAACRRPRRSARGRGHPDRRVLQGGNLHSCSFDPLEEAIAVARRHAAWVHVDGAKGIENVRPSRRSGAWGQR
jgi:hypothetical protein